MDVGVGLLVFQLGGEIYAADAKQVLEVGQAARGLSRGRGLVFQSPDGLKTLPVDRIQGLETARAEDLRKLPALVSAAAWAVGVWIRASGVVVLVDLAKM